MLLDLFAGRHSPVAVAASKQGIPHWEPIDVAIDEAHDILSDSFFTRLLRLAWSGRIALLVAAPPCRDYSILKLAPGGPPPCRTPEHINGLPSDSPMLARRAAESRLIHERCHQLCRAVAASGGHLGPREPPFKHGLDGALSPHANSCCVPRRPMSPQSLPALLG